MRFARITSPIALCAGALLLIAAQDAPEPAAEEAVDAAAEATDAAADAPEPVADMAEPAVDAAEPAIEASEAAGDASEPAADAEPAAAPAEATPAKGAPPTRAFMVGVWTEDLNKCGSALDFKADGSLIGPFPRWELTDEGVLTLVGSRQKIWLKVVDRNTMQSRRSETDPPRTLKRCPAAGPAE